MPKAYERAPPAAQPPADDESLFSKFDTAWSALGPGVANIIQQAKRATGGAAQDLGCSCAKCLRKAGPVREDAEERILHITHVLADVYEETPNPEDHIKQHHRTRARQFMAAVEANDVQRLESYFLECQEEHRGEIVGELIISASQAGHVDAIRCLAKYATDDDYLDMSDSANAATSMGRAVLRRGARPLMFAAHNGHVAAVRLLLELGADPNATDDHGYNALTISTFCDRAGVAEALCQHKETIIDQVDERERTALCYAALYGSDNCVHVLAAHGADVFHQDDEQADPLDLAEQSGRASTADNLRKLQLKARMALRRAERKADAAERAAGGLLDDQERARRAAQAEAKAAELLAECLREESVKKAEAERQLMLKKQQKAEANARKQLRAKGGAAAAALARAGSASSSDSGHHPLTGSDSTAAGNHHGNQKQGSKGAAGKAAGAAGGNHHPHSNGHKPHTAPCAPEPAPVSPPQPALPQLALPPDDAPEGVLRSAWEALLDEAKDCRDPDRQQLYLDAVRVMLPRAADAGISVKYGRKVLQRLETVAPAREALAQALRQYKGPKGTRAADELEAALKLARPAACLLDAAVLAEAETALESCRAAEDEEQLQAALQASLVEAQQQEARQLQLQQQAELVQQQAAIQLAQQQAALQAHQARHQQQQAAAAAAAAAPPPPPAPHPLQHQAPPPPPPPGAPRQVPRERPAAALAPSGQLPLRTVSTPAPAQQAPPAHAPPPQLQRGPSAGPHPVRPALVAAPAQPAVAPATAAHPVPHQQQQQQLAPPVSVPAPAHAFGHAPGAPPAFGPQYGHPHAPAPPPNSHATGAQPGTALATRHVTPQVPHMQHMPHMMHHHMQQHHAQQQHHQHPQQQQHMQQQHHMQHGPGAVGTIHHSGEHSLPLPTPAAPLTQQQQHIPHSPPGRDFVPTVGSFSKTHSSHSSLTSPLTLNNAGQQHHQQHHVNVGGAQTAAGINNAASGALPSPTAPLSVAAAALGLGGLSLQPFGSNSGGGLGSNLRGDGGGGAQRGQQQNDGGLHGGHGGGLLGALHNNSGGASVSGLPTAGAPGSAAGSFHVPGLTVPAALSALWNKPMPAQPQPAAQPPAQPAGQPATQPHQHPAGHVAQQHQHQPQQQHGGGGGAGMHHHTQHGFHAPGGAHHHQPQHGHGPPMGPPQGGRGPGMHAGGHMGGMAGMFGAGGGHHMQAMHHNMGGGGAGMQHHHHHAGGGGLHGVMMGQQANHVSSLLPPKGPNPSQRSSDPLCMACASTTRDAVCWPCLHVCLCMSCAHRRMSSRSGCPVCSQSIEQVIDVGGG